MALPSAKELTKLANACRKAGIKSFKGEGIEFTLTDDAPVKQSKKAAAAPAQAEQKFESDELPYEALLNWSVIDPAKEEQTA